MQHSPDLPPPAWNELESAAAQVSQQLSSRQLAFSNEQPPPALFEHLVMLLKCLALIDCAAR